MMFMMKPKEQAGAILEKLSKSKTADVEQPLPMDAEDAAIKALLSAFETKDPEAVKKHMRSYLDIYNTQADSEQPMPPGSEE